MLQGNMRMMILSRFGSTDAIRG